MHEHHFNKDAWKELDWLTGAAKKQEGGHDEDRHESVWERYVPLD